MMSHPRTVNSKLDSVPNQVASVQKTEIIELKNRQKELLKQIEAQAKANAILKSDRAKVDAAIAKYEGGKNEFSVTREKHRNEMRQLSNELHSNGKRCQKLDRKIRSTEDELNGTRDRLRCYHELVEKTNLEGAETLAERLRQKEESLREKDLEIQDLWAEIESFTLSQQEEVKSEKLQNQQAKKLVKDLKKELDEAVTKLKERSKEIDIRNIYQLRKASTSLQPLPPKSEKPNTQTFASKRHSDSVLSSRQKEKLYAINRRANRLRLRESLLEASIARTNLDKLK